MGERFTEENRKLDMKNCWHYELGVLLDGNLLDEFYLMKTSLMNGIHDKVINRM